MKTTPRASRTDIPLLRDFFPVPQPWRRQWATGLLILLISPCIIVGFMIFCLLMLVGAWLQRLRQYIGRLADVLWQSGGDAVARLLGRRRPAVKDSTLVELGDSIFTTHEVADLEQLKARYQRHDGWTYDLPTEGW